MKRDPKPFVVERVKINRPMHARAIKMHVDVDVDNRVKPSPKRGRAAWARELAALEFQQCRR